MAARHLGLALSQNISMFRIPLSPIPQAQFHRHKVSIQMTIPGGAIRKPQDQDCLPACKTTTQKPEPPAVIPGDDQYIVERILSHKINRPKGSKKWITQYLVKWEGYPDKENSLVDEIHDDLVKAYTATAEQLLRKRSVRLGRRKKMVTQYLVKWGGYADDQSVWINENNIHEDLTEAYRSATTTT